MRKNLLILIVILALVGILFEIGYAGSPPMLTLKKGFDPYIYTDKAYNISVLYTDPDGDMPESISLFIDDKEIPCDLSGFGPGDDYITGKEAVFENVKISERGSHTYHFEAKSVGEAESVKFPLNISDAPKFYAKGKYDDLIKFGIILAIIIIFLIPVTAYIYWSISKDFPKAFRFSMAIGLFALYADFTYVFFRTYDLLLLGSVGVIVLLGAIVLMIKR